MTFHAPLRVLDTATARGLLGVDLPQAWLDWLRAPAVPTPRGPAPDRHAAGLVGPAAAWRAAADRLAATLHALGAHLPPRGVEALAAAILNRLAPHGRTAETLEALCGRLVADPFAPPAADPMTAVCRRVARRAVAGALVDPTGGATHWHPRGEMPEWASGRAPRAAVAGLLFHRLEGRDAP